MADEATVPSKWRAGVSANPGGRPKWLKEAREAMREHVPTAVAKIVEIMGGTVGDEKVSVRMQMEAAREILDRVLGKPAQTIQGPDESPLIPGGSFTELEYARRVAFLLSQGLEAREIYSHPAQLNTLEPVPIDTPSGESNEQ